jgi:hypothetical protein
VIDVGRDERRIERECMCRDSGIEVLNPRAAAFQSRLDAATGQPLQPAEIHLRDCIQVAARSTLTLSEGGIARPGG